MNFDEAMVKISSLLRFGSMPGLDRIQKLLDRMGNPERDCRFVHVAGTNGKGSVCTMLSEIFIKSGYKTGLFTSPYITEFCDRIRINGEMIPKQEVAEIVERIFPIIEQMNSNNEPITEFECVTAIAFEYYSKSKCDVVVLETGLGGKYDSTNVILSPIASVITSISLDHTAVLGDTLDMIAGEKAGIIKDGCSTVFALQEKEVNDVFLNTANRLSNNVYTVDSKKYRIINESIKGTQFEYCGDEYFVSLPGVHQVKNACTVIEAIKPIKDAGYNISIDAVKYGIKKAFIPARLEVIKHDPLIILDGGHNPSGLAALSKAVRTFLCDKKIVCIMSMLKDKAVDDALSYLDGLFDKVYLVEIDNPRKMSADELKQVADKYFDDVEICLDKKLAVNKAQDFAEACNGAVLVCGSLYLASEIRKIILELE